MTSMDQPLGHAVGNALEVLEAVEALNGKGPHDLVEVVTALAARLLVISGAGRRAGQTAEKARSSLANGSALAKFRQWITTQGGDPAFIDDPGRLQLAPEKVEARSEAAGFVKAVDALAVGQTALMLGAGRILEDDTVDYGVGVIVHAKVGDRVKPGDILATVYARSVSQAQAAAGRILSAYSFDTEPVERPALFIQ
jgi:thymidine phosphorylase